MKRFTSTLVIALCLFSFSIISVPAVFAREAETTDDRIAVPISRDVQSSRESAKALVEQKKAALQQKIIELQATKTERLNDARKNVCEKRETAINGILDRRSEAGLKQKEVFDSIYSRVTSLVEDKNLTVENYDNLIAIIDEKQAAVEAAIAANTETEFTCESTDAINPGSVAKNNSSAIKLALQEYRAALKDLIVAVKPGLQKVEGNQ